uniref:Integrase catalytic domain-containing protein n=1 Tax=Acrobeloides nanus TaxID=290746 RepID=A0A914EGJ8_9BILA
MVEEVDELPSFLQTEAKNSSSSYEETKSNSKSETDGLEHYLPHRDICREDKENTKMRVVFDASAHEKGSKSLNDVLYKGSLLLKDLNGMIMRSRLPNILFSGDLEKAFLSIGLKEKDRDLVRFIWLIDHTKPPSLDNIRILRFRSVLFGATSGPFLLLKTLDHHLDKYPSKTAEEIKENKYMDNIHLGASKTEEMVEKVKETKAIFNDCSMNCREMITNDPEVNAQIPLEDRLNKTEVKILGVRWNTEEDVFIIKMPSITEEFELSKRYVAHVIAKAYDPISFLGPCYIEARRFMQSLWNSNLEWDEILPESSVSEWKKITEGWKNFVAKIPRQIMPKQLIPSKTNLQLHTFVDASSYAFCSLSYLRIETPQETTCQFLFGKSRLFPLNENTLTMPRKELIAAVTGSRAQAYIRSQLEAHLLKFYGLKIEANIIWTDSLAVFYWTMSTKSLTTFVINRVNEINEKAADVTWRYINTKINPADIGSRGCSPKELMNMKEYFHGPNFLIQPSNEWPKTLDSSEIKKIKDQEILKEEKKAKKIVYQASLLAQEEQSCFIETKIFSSWNKLKRITTWILRFIKKTYKKTPKGSLLKYFYEQEVKNYISSKEIHVAESLIFLQEQKLHKPSIQFIKEHGIQQKEFGILTFTGRFENSEHATKELIVLSPRSHISSLIIQDLHQKNMHSGLQQTKADFRLKYFMPKTHQMVKKILFSCRGCKRFRARPFTLPNMAPLPSSRLTPSKIFEATGVDYFGDVKLKDVNEEVQKIWVAVFTCFTTRLTHFEVVHDLSAKGFLNAFIRFISRRSRPSKFVSDNGTQFELASKVIIEAWRDVQQQEDFMTYFAQEGIAWEFNSPLAPWRGGIFERIIGLTKSTIRKSIGRRFLTYEEFSTLLIQVEAVLNSRPLTTTDAFEVILRPIDFVIPAAKIGTPWLCFENNYKDPEYKPIYDSKEQLLNYWRFNQKMLENFWYLWKRDYLLLLRERQKVLFKSAKSKNPEFPKVGEIILLEDETPRGSWRIAKITEVVKSSDNAIRTATVQLPNGKKLLDP